MNAVYREVGISKQAVAQYEHRQQILNNRAVELLSEADELREEHPGCGVRKMYNTLKPDFIGRDRFIEMMMELGYRLKRKKNYRKTTSSGLKYYPNLIKGLEVDGPSQVWQSDTTYIEVGDRFYYATFIIDVYTKKIVGYKVADHLRATANVEALKMAIRDHPAPKIHHSDRGHQYLYHEYTDLLRSKGASLSMAKIAQDNAYAERINKTIKEEYLDYWKPKNLNQLKRMMRKAVEHYNHKRQHNHLGKISPVDFEKSLSGINSRKIITIFDNELVT